MLKKVFMNCTVRKGPNRQIKMPIQKIFTPCTNMVYFTPNRCNVILLGHIVVEQDLLTRIPNLSLFAESTFEICPIKVRSGVYQWLDGPKLQPVGKYCCFRYYWSPWYCPKAYWRVSKILFCFNNLLHCTQKKSKLEISPIFACFLLRFQYEDPKVAREGPADRLVLFFLHCSIHLSYKQRDDTSRFERLNHWIYGRRTKWIVTNETKTEQLLLISTR